MKNMQVLLHHVFIAALICIVNHMAPAQPSIAGFTFIGVHNQHYYYVSDCEASWLDASLVSSEMHGDLISISNYDEYAYIHNWMYEQYTYGEGIAKFWIGLYDPQDNDEYVWVNGEDLGFETWNSEATSPDNNWFVMTSENGHWLLQPENAQNHYIVEFPTPGPACLNGYPIICHNGNTFCINPNSLQVHLNHGDYLGPCDGCNSPENLAAAPHEESEVAKNSLADRMHAHEEADSGHHPNSVTEWRVYPNPTTGHVRIQLPVHIEQCTLDIRTLTGQELESISVTHDEPIALDMSRYASGVYLIEVQSMANRWQQKLIKL